MTSSFHTLHTKAGMDAVFSSLSPSTRGFDRHSEEILPGLDTADAAGAGVFAMPDVDNVDAFERQVVEYVKPNHGTLRSHFVRCSSGGRCGRRADRARAESKEGGQRVKAAMYRLGWEPLPASLDGDGARCTRSVASDPTTIIETSTLSQSNDRQISQGPRRWDSYSSMGSSSRWTRVRRRALTSLRSPSRR